ncbi:hypothetical protein J5X84_30950 [Streptosporangiaceae bacterium NEAU-GS5]|nr:hypothetical protein [Streptosporangiaceae bacterium NEAU-GS5]
MTNHIRPTPDDLLRHARQYYELATLLKYDKEFEDKFTAAVEASDEGRLGSLLEPLGMRDVTISSIDTRAERGVCEHCWVWHGKLVCHPICM